MDRQKPRKEHESRRTHCDGMDFPVNGRITYDEKNKCKRHQDKKKCDTSLSSCSMKWSPQARLHPVSHRQYSTSDSSVCHYSVPLSFSFEPVSLPIYPAVIQPHGSCTLPLGIENHSNRLKNYKYKNRKSSSKCNSTLQNDSPAIFSMTKIKNGDTQDYASLPPVNYDIYAAKTTDEEAACRRRFSDPGLGQVSSDECSSSKSDNSNDSSQTAEVQSCDFYTLLEQINELKECNSFLKKELNETKLELEAFKMQSFTWKMGCEDFQPGALSDAISEIRNAVKLSEEALILKVVQMLEKNFNECKEARDKLEEKLRTEYNESINIFKEQLEKTPWQHPNSEKLSRDISEAPEIKDSDIQQQILELEKEKFQLRKELQEAVAKRKTAEATTEKLERLVGILRKKINGVSLESCMPEEKHILVRPLASSFEKNPFIIANNRQGQKPDTVPFAKPKIPSFKAYPLENSEGPNVVLFENKENENAEADAGNGSPSNHHPPSETAVTAQVTITGPVTDL